MRCVGFEFELTGVRPEEAAVVVVRQLGGQIQQTGPLEALVTGTSLGDFTARFGATGGLHYAHPGARQDAIDTERAAEALRRGPCELVTPPIPIARLEELEPVWHQLHSQRFASAEVPGRQALALRLVPDLPAVDLDTILAVARSFVVLGPWLFEAAGIDRLSRLSPRVTLYPRAYEELILCPGYRPCVEVFTADYLRFNPTPTRALDLLPCLAVLDREQVQSRSRVCAGVVPRPAVRYRLHSCELDDPLWSPALEWNRWTQIEQLAYDGDRLAAACRKRLHACIPAQRMWLHRVRRWIDRLAHPRPEPVGE